MTAVCAQCHLADGAVILELPNGGYHPLNAARFAAGRYHGPDVLRIAINDGLCQRCREQKEPVSVGDLLVEVKA